MGSWTPSGGGSMRGSSTSPRNLIRDSLRALLAERGAQFQELATSPERGRAVLRDHRVSRRLSISIRSWRPRLDPCETRRRGSDALDYEAGPTEKAVPVLARSLASPEKHEHVHIEQLAEIWFGARP